MKNFKFVIKSNQIQDCPIVVEDIKTAEQICGKDISHIEGKTTRHNPTMQEDKTMAMPKELKEQNKEITLCIDMMCINKVGFMTSILHPLCHRGCTHVPQNNEETFHAAIDEMLRTCNKGRHCIKTIECDQEFQSIVEVVADKLGVTMDCANAQDHVAAAECNNGTPKESMQTVFHRSGYTTTPKAMIMALAEHSADTSNVFPAKHGTLEHCSPETTVTGHTLHCKQHCQHEFGTCVQAHHAQRKKNSMKERSVDAMCPRPTHSE